MNISAMIADEGDRALVADVCARRQWPVHFTGNCDETWKALNQRKAPIVLCDRDLAGTEWRETLHMMASSPHHACAILLSRVADDYLRDEVIHQGGYDVLPKPLREEDVVKSVRLALSYWGSSANAPPSRFEHHH